MARAAETYRAARRNAARAAHWKAPMVKYTVVKDGLRTSVAPLPQPRYMPYFCKQPRLKFGPFQVGAKSDPVNDVMVPYTELRKQPRVYRGKRV